MATFIPITSQDTDGNISYVVLRAEKGEPVVCVLEGTQLRGGPRAPVDLPIGADDTVMTTHHANHTGGQSLRFIKKVADSKRA